MRARELFIPLLCLALAAGVQLAAADTPLQQATAEITRLQSQRALAARQAGLLGDQVGMLAGALANLKRDREGQQKAFADMRRQLLEMDVQLARLAAPYDLANALDAYTKASEGGKPEAFKALFQLARGRTPNNEEMAQFRLEADMLGLEIRKKAMVPVGLALAEIGDIVIKYVGGVTKIAGYSNKMLDATRQLSGRDILGDLLQPILEDLTQRLVGRITVELVKQETREMAQDSYRQYKEAVYGNVDPTAARNLLRGEREKLAAALSKLEVEIAGLDPLLEQLRLSLRTVQERLAREESGLAAIDRALAAAEERQEQVRLAQEEAQVRQQLAGRQGQILVSRLNLVMPGLDQYHRHIDLAADDLTALVLALPREVSYHLDIGLAEATSTPCLYCEYHEDSHKTLCHAATKTVILSAGQVARFGNLAPLVEGAALKVDSRASKVVAQAPGRSEVRLQAEGMLRGESSPHARKNQAASGQELQRHGQQQGIKTACDWNQRPVMGTLQGSGIYPVVAHRVQDLRLLERHWMQGSADQWLPARSAQDWFLADAGVILHGATGTQLQAEVGVLAEGNGIRWSPIRNTAALMVELDGAAVRLERNMHNRELRLEPHAPGRASLQVALADGTGQRQFERRLDFNVHRLTGIEVEMPEREYGRDRNALLAIGETAKLRFRIEGPGDLARYRVRWQAAGNAEGARFEPLATPIRHGDSWSADTRFQFDPGLIHGKEFKQGRLSEVLDARGAGLRAELLGPDGQLIASAGTVSFLPTLPHLRNLEFALLDGGVLRVAALDLFFPAPPGGYLGRLGLVAEYAGGEVVLPLSMVDLERVGHFPEFFRLESARHADAPGVMRLLSGGRQHTTLTSRDTGTGVLQAALGIPRAHDQSLKLAQDSLHDSLPLRFNRLQVERLGDMNHPARFRLLVIGPSDIGNYTVRWTLADGATETGRPERGADGQSSSTQHAYSGFEKVELISPTGRVAATYLGSRDGTPLPTPYIQIDAVDSERLQPGATLRIGAAISGVRVQDAADYLCRWEVDPSFGQIDPASTLQVELVFGRCETSLRLADDPDIAGRPFPVKVRLIRQTGVAP